jgi:hypothetical protein
MLKFKATDVSYLLLDSNAQVEEGQRVLVIGTPEGLQGTVSEGTFTVREVGDLTYVTQVFSWTVMNAHQRLSGKSSPSHPAFVLKHLRYRFSREQERFCASHV